MKTACDIWLDTVTDAELGDHSQVSLANEAWMRGAAHAAQQILLHLEYISTPKLAAAGCPAEATAIGTARVSCDEFIRKGTKN